MQTQKLPFGYQATFRTTPLGAYEVEWTPSVPRFASARAKRRFNKAYFAARDAFVTDVAALTGNALGIIDLGTSDGMRIIGPPTRH